MLHTLGIVQVRPDRLAAGWKTSRGFGGKSLVEWVVRRATECARLDGVIVVGPSAERAALEALTPPDVPFFHSPRPDALGQLADALFHYDAANIVRIGLEHPFIDPVLVDRLVAHAATIPTADYVGYRTRAGEPAAETALSCGGELCKARALRVADRDATGARDRAEPTRWLYRRPERFTAGFLALPDELDRGDMRLSLAGSEDWDVLEDLCDALGDEPDWHDVTEYLSSQPRLRRRMAALNEAR